MSQGQQEPTEEGTSETTSMASVGTPGPPLPKVGREGFPRETARTSMT